MTFEKRKYKRGKNIIIIISNNSKGPSSSSVPIPKVGLLYIMRTNFDHFRMLYPRLSKIRSEMRGTKLGIQTLDGF